MGGLDAAWDQAGEVRGCAAAVKTVPVQTLASGAGRTVTPLMRQPSGVSIIS